MRYFIAYVKIIALCVLGCGAIYAFVRGPDWSGVGSLIVLNLAYTAIGSPDLPAENRNFHIEYNEDAEEDYDEENDEEDEDEIPKIKKNESPEVPGLSSRGRFETLAQRDVK